MIIPLHKKLMINESLINSNHLILSATIAFKNFIALILNKYTFRSMNS